MLNGENASLSLTLSKAGLFQLFGLRKKDVGKFKKLRRMSR